MPRANPLALRSPESDQAPAPLPPPPHRRGLADSAEGVDEEFVPGCGSSDGDGGMGRGFPTGRGAAQGLDNDTQA